MSKRLAAIAAAALITLPAQATVIFNWVQTGTPAPFANQYQPFSLGVSDSTFLAAQGAPITFGVISVGQSDFAGNKLRITVGSPDVTAMVLVNSFVPGQSGLYNLSEGLAICNTPEPTINSCQARYSSSVAQPGGWFASQMKWGGNTFERGSSYSFTLAGDKLAVSAYVGPDNNVSMRTGADGTGMFSAGSDGVEVIKGYGYFQVDASTIPTSVPLPPSAWLMALGLAGIALRTRRR